jgi:hypothetical protein
VQLPLDGDLALRLEPVTPAAASARLEPRYPDSDDERSSSVEWPNPAIEVTWSPHAPAGDYILRVETRWDEADFSAKYQAPVRVGRK